ncbi:8280_t:CDS:2 [Gigaspora rosea]|nr:8280_t:CDS:2 [Gigaspora rosea]
MENTLKVNWIIVKFKSATIIKDILGRALILQPQGVSSTPQDKKVFFRTKSDAVFEKRAAHLRIRAFNSLHIT